MENSINVSILLMSIASLLFSLVAWFVRQLHADFKRFEQDIGEIKTSIRLIQADMKSGDELINQRIGFLERRLSLLEKQQTEDG